MKTISLIMVMLLSFSVLSACGGGGGSDKTGDIDLEGREIKIAAWWDDLPSADATDEATKLRYNRMKELEEKYNCTFKAVVVEQTEISTNFDANMLSGDLFADIIYMRSDAADTYFSKGQLYPVSDAFDLTKEHYNKSINDRYTSNGKTYAFSTYDNNLESLVYFNKDVFERVGLEAPYTLVKENKWTWDTFKTYVTKATVASGGNTEVYGFYGVIAEPNVSQILATYSAAFATKSEDGLYKSGLSDENLSKGLNFIRDMNTSLSGVYVPAADSLWSDSIQMFSDGKVAMMINGFSAASTLKESMSDDYGIVPLPTVNAGDAYVQTCEAHNVRVMQGNMDPELAKDIAYVYSQLVAPLYEDEAEALEQERTTYEQRLCDSESVDIIMDMIDKETSIFNHMSAANESFWRLEPELRTALRGETTVASVIAAHQSAFEEELTRTNAESMK